MSDFNGFRRMNKKTVTVFTLVDGPLGIECDVLDAKPQPQIQWFNTITRSVIAEVPRKIQYLDNGRYLFIHQLSSEQRRIQYHCEVSSAFLNKHIRAPTTFDISGNLTTKNLTLYRPIPSVINVYLGEVITFVIPAVAPMSIGRSTIVLCSLPPEWNGRIMTIQDYSIRITGIERTGIFQITCRAIGGLTPQYPTLPPITFRVTSKTQV